MMEVVPSASLVIEEASRPGVYTKRHLRYRVGTWDAASLSATYRAILILHPGISVVRMDCFGEINM